MPAFFATSSRSRRVVVSCLFVCCLSLVAGSSAEGLSPRMTPIVKAVRAAEASIVNIRGEKTVNGESLVIGEGEPGRHVNGMGTGVVIDPRGYIITNHHVVSGVREIQVTLADGRRFVARSIAHDPETDLAVIKIDVPEKLPVLRIGRSSDLMTGETVIAVGNAYGYENTVTQGIVSALHRAVQVSDAQFYSDLIQTDASINPGNSGGPLLNIDGEMIGINVAVRAGAQGIGFAIPIDKAMRVASDLLDRRNVRSVRHGLVLGDTAPREGRGLSVVSIDEDSPAAAAGIRPGDVVTRIGDVEVDGPIDFQRSLLERLPGDELRLALRRDNRAVNVDLTLAAASAASKANTSPAWEALGMNLERISPGDFRRRFKTSYRGGLNVTAVRPDGPAATQGIRPGDVLVGIHIWEAVSLEHVSYILEKSDAATEDSVKFFILRDGGTFYGYVSLASTSKKTR